MKIDENRLIEYLENHIGENCRTVDLAKICGMYNEAGDFHIDLKTDGEIRRIAAKNGYSFNSSHHDNEEIGMPWVIDFYIEAAISKKAFKQIRSA
ncbi:MAG: hypothetical protein IIZ80_07560 [Erysipelotrichaceae bacterium]|nr:hypothetical protein [Erysipelotrichaceae bacterium]